MAEAPIDDVEHASKAVEDVTSAYQRATCAIRDVRDPDAAFALATRLGDALNEHGQTNRGVRRDLLANVAAAHSLEVAASLAAHVTRTGVPMTRQRVEQILKPRPEQEGKAA